MDPGDIVTILTFVMLVSAEIMLTQVICQRLISDSAESELALVAIKDNNSLKSLKMILVKPDDILYNGLDAVELVYSKLLRNGSLLIVVVTYEDY